MSSDSHAHADDRRGIEPTSLRAGLVGAAALALVVGLTWAVVRGGRVVAADHEALRNVLDHRSQVLTAAFRVITSLGDVRAVVAVGAFGVAVLVVRRRRDLAVVLVVSSTGTWLLVNWLKLLIERPRPPDAVRLVAASGWSFPSGHAGQGAAMYLALGVLILFTAERRSTRLGAIGAGAAAAVLIGASRVYLGVHWVSDVVAGWSLAIAWLALLLAGVGWRSGRRREIAADPDA